MLKRLQMDYIDIVFSHRPHDDTPMEETVRGMIKNPTKQLHDKHQ